MKKLITIILIFCCILSLLGCKKSSKTSQNLENILSEMEELGNRESGTITIDTKIIPSHGNLESLKSERKEKVSLDFEKKDDTIDYNYSEIINYKNKSTETKIKSDKDILYTLSDSEWVKSDQPKVDYYNLIFSMITFKYKEKDIKNIKISNSNNYKIIKVTISKKALSKKVKKLTYSFWTYQKKISKIIIDQLDTMTIDSQSDTIRTTIEINIS